MAEINEKDLEKAAGGDHFIDGSTIKHALQWCDKYERDPDRKNTFFKENCCDNCTHSELYSPIGYRLKCRLGVE